MRVLISIFKNNIVFFGLVFVFLLIVLSYHQVLTSYFVSDDWEWIPKIESLNLFEIHKIFSPPRLGGIESAFWRPVIPFTFWVNYKIGGLNPSSYHLTNILFHLGNVFLLFLISSQLFQNKEKILTKLAPVVLALLFAVFPLHSESVSWIGGRYDVIVTFFYLLSLVGFLFYVRDNSSKFLFLSLISFVLALLTKENAITLPIAIIMFLLILGKKWYGYYLIWFFGILIVWALIKFFYVPSTLGHFAYHGFFISRLFLIYLVLLSLGLILYSLGRAKFLKNLIFFWIFLGILLLPTAFLPTSERFLYLPSVALILTFGEVLFLSYPYLISVFPKKEMAVAVMIIGISLIVVSEFTWLFLRNQRWVVAGDIAKRIIAQTKNLTQNSDNFSTLYFLNLPDNYDGAYIYRTYFDLALRYNGVQFGNVFVLTTNSGVDQSKVSFVDNKSFLLESQIPFVIFRPAVTKYLLDGSILIDNIYAQVIIAPTLNTAHIKLKEDYLDKKDVYFFYFDGNKIQEI